MRHRLSAAWLAAVASAVACSGPGPTPVASAPAPAPPGPVEADRPPPEHSEHAEHEKARLGAAEADAGPGAAAGPPAAGPHAHGEHGHRVGTAQHRFDDPERWAKVFESAEREAWQKPDAVIERLALARDATVADVGAGTGYFAVRLARYLRLGTVYAVDVEPRMVEFLQGRAQRERLPNLLPVLGTPEDPKVPAPVDLVLLVDTYHHIDGRVAYFRRLAGQLKPGGRVAVVDFTMGDIPVGPPKSHRIAPEIIEREMAEAGYERVLRDDALLPYQHVLVFARPAGRPGRQ